MKKICFVCFGGTCRSFMAKMIMKDLLKKTNIKLFEIQSRGIFVENKSKVNVMAVNSLNKLGIKANQIFVQKLSKKLDTNTLYLFMTNELKKLVKTDYKNIFTFAEFVGGSDIEDPYGKNQMEYDKTSEQIKVYCERLLEIIKRVKENKNDNISL